MLLDALLGSHQLLGSSRFAAVRFTMNKRSKRQVCALPAADGPCVSIPVATKMLIER